MALTPGTRLGPYEIVSALGAGGMGEVYRATDSNLKRAVAIKVLPASLADDPARLLRFQREAEALAALNHPNIAAIYGLERGLDGREGPEGRVGPFLVMELVEGEDLSDRIARGPLPLDEALPIARQIAEALEAAHEQGIVHRDLKPANIKLRADGTAKVLDFGLAKALEKPGGPGRPGEPGTGASPSDRPGRPGLPDLPGLTSPTLTSPAMLTGEGIILGTAAYMAPEQARGKAVDKRADIWAFGCVLYEMLTGTRLFAGDSVAETLGLIFSREPDLPALPAATPTRVRMLIARCLVKDPRQRLRDIGDARLALDGAFDGPSPATAAPIPASTTARGRSAWMGIGLLGLAGMVAMALPTARHLRETPAAPPDETRLEIVTPATDRPTDFALSPDGRQIVFGARGDGVSRLWLRPLASTTAQPLAGTEGATFPFWSPDGRSIGFFAGGALKRLDIGGGAPQALAPVTLGSGGSWNTDGVILYAPNNATTRTPLMRVSASGGPATAATTVGPQQSGHSRPFFLPDGHRFLYAADGAPDAAGIFLGTLGGGTPTRLTPSDTGGVWLPPGWLLWVRSDTRTLVARRLDLEKAALTGDPVQVADGVAVISSTGASVTSALSVSRTGLIAYLTGSASSKQLTWVDRTGAVRGSVGEPDTSLINPRVSPDGRRIVVSRSVQGNQDLWVVDTLRLNRLTFDPAGDAFSVWSPDGTRVAFNSRRNGPLDLFQKGASGTGTDESLLTSDQTKVPFSWSSDGRLLFYSSYDPKTNADLWVLTTSGERRASAILKTPFRETQPMISPDGRWLAYLSDQSGRNEVYVRPFVAPGTTAAAADAQWQISTAGGIYPVWRRDGKELFYLDPSGAMMGVPVTVAGNTFDPGAPTLLFPTRIFGGGVDSQQGRNYDVAPDGRFLINSVLPGATSPITLIQNWTPEGKK